MTFANAGSAYVRQPAAYTNPLELTLTTTLPETVLILGVITADIGGFRNVSSVSGGSLSWNQRGSRIQELSTGQSNGWYWTAEYWWAPCTSVLNAQSIQINFDIAPYLTAALIVAVSGASNYLSPFNSDIIFPVRTESNNVASYTKSSLFDITTAGLNDIQVIWYNAGYYTFVGSAFGLFADVIEGPSPLNPLIVGVVGDADNNRYNHGTAATSSEFVPPLFGGPANSAIFIYMPQVGNIATSPTAIFWTPSISIALGTTVVASVNRPWIWVATN